MVVAGAVPLAGAEEARAESGCVRDTLHGESEYSTVLLKLQPRQIYVKLKP